MQRMERAHLIKPWSFILRITEQVLEMGPSFTGTQHPRNELKVLRVKAAKDSSDGRLEGGWMLKCNTVRDLAKRKRSHRAQGAKPQSSEEIY